MSWTREEKWHVYPVNDIRMHMTEGFMCWCHPRIQEQENGDYVVVHNSLDGRELKEEKRKSN